MQIEIRLEIIKEIENIVPTGLYQDELNEFSDWLLCIGLSTIKMALQTHPELSIMDFMMLEDTVARKT